MKNPQRLSQFLSWCITVSLLLAATFGILVCDRASAKSNNHQSDRLAPRGDKVAPDLRTKVRRSQRQRSDDGDLLKVILQFNAPPSALVNTLLKRNGVRVRRHFQNLNSKAVELPANVVDQLAAFPEVQTVSLDAEVQSFGHVSLTTGADEIGRAHV